MVIWPAGAADGIERVDLVRSNKVFLFKMGRAMGDMLFGRKLRKRMVRLVAGEARG